MPKLEEEETEHGEYESTETKEENNSTQELIKLLQERLKIYEIAEEKAKRKDESSRARRYNRGIKTLKEMLVSIQSGRRINEADIPAVLPPSATDEPTIRNIGSTYFFRHYFYGYISLLIICNLSLRFYLKIKTA